MAYDRTKIFEQARDAITEHNLHLVEDVVAFLPCDKTTFYRFFKVDSNEYNELRRLLDDNKTRTKAAIRKKLLESNKAAELLALYRLLATSDEHKRLNQQYIDHTSEGGKLPDLRFVFTDSPDANSK